MTTCVWCGCEVDVRRIDIDGNHHDFMGCIEALRIKVKKLTQELIDERAMNADLTDQLEKCSVCPFKVEEEKK